MSTPDRDKSARSFTINRNLLLISNYIRCNEFVTNINISHEIVLLINNFYMNQIFEQFDDMILLEGTVKALKEHGIKDLSFIPRHCLESILNGNDVITKARPFSYNKLCTISIASLQMVNIDINDCQVLIVSPSREKAQMLYKNTTLIGKYLNNISNDIIIGGTTVAQDIQHMVSSKHIINGVVERIYCMIKQRAFNVDKLKLFILDDANQLFDKGFKEQIEQIIHYLPNNIQIAIFSSNETKEFESKYMTNNTVHVKLDNSLNSKDLSMINVKHYYVRENEQYKFETLCDILDCIVARKCIIFCNTKQKMMELYEQLMSNDFHVSIDLDEFQNGDVSILVKADDCLENKDNDIDYNCNYYGSCLKINYDLAAIKSFLSRNGSYNQKKGISIHFICDDLQMNDMINLEKQYHFKMDELPINIQSILK